MSLRSSLAVWAYTSPTTAAYPLIVSEYGEQVEALELTTVAPGGFGDLACIVKLRDARIPRPELGLFSRVCVRSGADTVFSGEWSDPALVLDGTSGEYVSLSALGGGVALRDDPDDSSYASQTAQAIIAAEFAKRAAFLAVDADLSAVLPSAPSATFTPAYDGYTLEEICHDLAFALGDYVWSVYDHPTNRDPAGYPTWRLEMHPRDTATTHYIALAEDILGWHVSPSQQRAFNVVQLAYVDPGGGPGTVTVSDPRLAGGGAQGSAPFRRRKLRRVAGRVPLTAAQATVIAQAWLAAYENVTNKVSVELKGLRDSYGSPIPLVNVRADKNLYIPELAVRGQQLSSGPVPTVNQFWIAESRYRETAAGDVSLVLSLDNYADQGGAILAQLKLAYDAAARARGSVRQIISPGVPLTGPCGAALTNELAGGTVSIVVPFGVTLAKAPSSVTLSSVTSTNASAIAAVGPTQTGFTLQWTVGTSGATAVKATYTTVGN